MSRFVQRIIDLNLPRQQWLWVEKAISDPKSSDMVAAVEEATELCKLKDVFDHCFLLSDSVVKEVTAKVEEIKVMASLQTNT